MVHNNISDLGVTKTYYALKCRHLFLRPTVVR